MADSRGAPAGPAAGSRPGRSPAQRPALRPVIGTLVSIALLVAAVLVIVLRLHHPAFGVEGAAITGQVPDGCTVNVTGRIDTTGGAGTVSYQWVLQPGRPTQQALAAPRNLRQPVSAGQTALYVTAAVEGTGHGRLAQTVTLRVLGPGPARASSAHVVVSC